MSLKTSLGGGEGEEERRGRVMGSGACGLALLECGMGLIALMNVGDSTHECEAKLSLQRGSRGSRREGGEERAGGKVDLAT